MKIMVIADASGLPLAARTDSASPHEVTLVKATVDEMVTVGRTPGRIIGDRANDSDPLDRALVAQGIELIAPHRSNRKRATTQDGKLSGKARSACFRPGQSVAGGIFFRPKVRDFGMAAGMNKKSMSSQAVGGAIGHNPISIIIPCHRVVGSNGSLTGYSRGITTKMKLLEREGLDLSRFFVPKKSTAL